MNLLSFLYSQMVRITKQEAQLTNPRDAFRGQSSPPNIVPFHMLGMVYYYCEIVTLPLRHTVFLIFDFKNVDLEMRVTGHLGGTIR